MRGWLLCTGLMSEEAGLGWAGSRDQSRLGSGCGSGRVGVVDNE